MKRFFGCRRARFTDRKGFKERKDSALSDARKLFARRCPCGLTLLVVQEVDNASDDASMLMKLMMAASQARMAIYQPFLPAARPFLERPCLRALEGSSGVQLADAIRCRWRHRCRFAGVPGCGRTQSEHIGRGKKTFGCVFTAYEDTAFRLCVCFICSL